MLELKVTLRFKSGTHSMNYNSHLLRRKNNLFRLIIITTEMYKVLFKKFMNT